MRSRGDQAQVTHRPESTGVSRKRAEAPKILLVFRQMRATFQPLDIEAAKYVEAHGLEESLSVAVDAAMQARSNKPLAVIIRHLQKVLEGCGRVEARAADVDDVSESSPALRPGRGSDGPLSLELHVKARSQENPVYPKRLIVPDDAVRWSAAWLS